jgi:hypothetical protein
MNANELIVRAQDLCRAMRRPFPAEIKAFSRDWHRQCYDLEWAWGTLKGALKERRALWQVDVEVHRHHDQLQRDRDAQNVRAGEPMEERWWETQSPEQVSDEDPQQPSPTLAMGVGDRPCAEPRQTHPAPRQQTVLVLGSVRDPDKINPERQKKPRKTRRRREGTLTADRQVWLRALFADGKSKATSLIEHLARKKGWLKADEPIGKNSPFKDARRALGVITIRRGFGRRGHHEWLLPPPAWSRGLFP